MFGFDFAFAFFFLMEAIYYNNLNSGFVNSSTLFFFLSG